MRCIPLRDGHNEYALANLCRLICLHLVNLFKIDFLSKYKLGSTLSKQQSGGLLLHRAALNSMFADSSLTVCHYSQTLCVRINRPRCKHAAIRLPPAHENATLTGVPDDFVFYWK